MRSETTPFRCTLGSRVQLLSDALVDSVPGGVAAAAASDPAMVYSPRSGTGEGVDLSGEPATTALPRVRTGRDFRPYVRIRRERKLGVQRVNTSNAIHTSHGFGSMHPLWRWQPVAGQT